MSSLDEVKTAFSLWADCVAQTISAPIEKFRPVRRVEAVEGLDGEFTLQLAQGADSKLNASAPIRIRMSADSIDPSLPAEWTSLIRDSRVDIVLQPARFLFRPLELPKKATEFLDGIVRSQIDRLTPWSVGDAVYHWTAPTEMAGGRMTTTIVATARNTVMSYVQAFVDLHAVSVGVSTVAPDRGRISIHKHKAGGVGDLGRIRTALVVAFLGSGLLAMVSTAASGIVAGHYESEYQQVQRRIAERRAVIRRGQSKAGNTALELLEQRKQTTPASVLVIEALSTVLPDHTYVTEVRIEGDKLQILGLTQDAPSLIPLLEQSPHFTRATFFAPTTRAPNDPGERFHIEAKIVPHFGSGT